MLTTLMTVNAILCTLIIILVLVQFGKGAEAGLMAGGASEAILTGAQRGNILTRITTFLVVIFMANSILMAKMQNKGSEKSLLDTETAKAAAAMPKEMPFEVTPGASSANQAQATAPNAPAPVEKAKKSKSKKKE